MKILFVRGDDYTALSFKNEFSGRLVSDIIEIVEKDGLEEDRTFEGNGYLLYTTIYDVGDIDPIFYDFIRDEIQDYDHKKHKDFFLETETIKV